MQARERIALNKKNREAREALKNKKVAPVVSVKVDPKPISEVKGVDPKSSETIRETIAKDGTKRGTNPNSTKNLKPFKPGESGNPSGKPEGVLNWNTKIELNLNILAQKYVKEFNKKNPKKLMKIEDVDMESDIFQQYLNKARNGNDKILLHFMDKRYGKASQPIELEYTIKVKEFEDSIDEEEDKWFESDDDED